MRKLQQLYVEDDLYMDVKGLATLKKQKIKTVVSNFLKAGFKTEGFFEFCKSKHIENIKERMEYKEQPLGFDIYCELNLDYLKDEYHKFLLD